MKEHTGFKFLGELFAFLDDAIESGAEVHIMDHSDPDKVVEHVFNADEPCEECDDDLPFTDEDICPYDGSCDECPYEKECAADLAAIPECDGECEFCCDDLYGTEPHMWGIPDIDHVVFSGPATIIFWTDGDKTVVKCMEGEKYERYAGFMAACMKKMFGSTSRAKAVMDYFAVDQLQKEKKKERTVAFVPDMTEAFSAVVKQVEDEAEAEQIAHNEAIKEAVNEALSR